ncbi:MAG: MoaD/ThiS family protein [Planctomycetes bacterium]|nr:MoaD/ThiS family protein [Planctomycetota bacterium]
MATVAFARHLYEFFPALKGAEVRIDALTVAELVRKLDVKYPGIAFYIADERGGLRQHVNIFIEEELVRDRRTLSDHLTPDSKVYVMQALSGG